MDCNHTSGKVPSFHLKQSIRVSLENLEVCGHRVLSEVRCLLKAQDLWFKTRGYPSYVYLCILGAPATWFLLQPTCAEDISHPGLGVLLAILHAGLPCLNVGACQAMPYKSNSGHTRVAY